MDGVFRIGWLQPLIDDPSIENVEVTVHDKDGIALADGREVRGEPVASPARGDLRATRDSTT